MFSWIRIDLVSWIILCCSGCVAERLRIFRRMIISNIGDVKSFADDLNIQRSIVSGRVPLLVRSAEIKLLLDRFVLLWEHLSPIHFYNLLIFLSVIESSDNESFSIFEWLEWLGGGRNFFWPSPRKILLIFTTSPRKFYFSPSPTKIYFHLKSNNSNQEIFHQDQQAQHVYLAKSKTMQVNSECNCFQGFNVLQFWELYMGKQGFANHKCKKMLTRESQHHEARFILELRPYKRKSTGSRLISAVKPVMALSVLWWGTTWEYRVL